MLDEQNIPGVPEGFDLIHASRIAEEGEWFIDNCGHPFQAVCRTIRHVSVIKRSKKRVLVVPETELPNGHEPDQVNYALADDSLHAIPFSIEERDA